MERFFSSSTAVARSARRAWNWRKKVRADDSWLVSKCLLNRPLHVGALLSDQTKHSKPIVGLPTQLANDKGRSLSALARAEVTFWFTCRRKQLVARADGRGERCRMTVLATWASAYI